MIWWWQRKRADKVAKALTEPIVRICRDCKHRFNSGGTDYCRAHLPLSQDLVTGKIARFGFSFRLRQLQSLDKSSVLRRTGPLMGTFWPKVVAVLAEACMNLTLIILGVLLGVWSQCPVVGTPSQSVASNQEVGQ